MDMPAKADSSGRLAFLKDRLEGLGLDVSNMEDSQDESSHHRSRPLPTLKHGYPMNRFQWSDLQRIILEENDLAKLARCEEEQRCYEMFRHSLSQQYCSVLDYILVSKFSFEKKKSEDDERWRAFPSLEDYTETTKVLVPNDFPYFMEQGIVHYILWKTNGSISGDDIEGAKQELAKDMEVSETLHWINPPHLQSIPQLNHVHILCRLAND